MTLYVATSFSPACGPSSGHYARTQKHTGTLYSLRLDISSFYIKNVYTVDKGAVKLQDAHGYLKKTV
jgi:hypothetical protein